MFDSFSPHRQSPRRGCTRGRGSWGPCTRTPYAASTPAHPGPHAGAGRWTWDTGPAALGAGVSSLCPRPPCPAFGSSLSPMDAVPRHGGVGGTSAPAWHRSVAGLIGQGLGGGRGDALHGPSCRDGSLGLRRTLWGHWCPTMASLGHAGTALWAPIRPGTRSAPKVEGCSSAGRGSGASSKGRSGGWVLTLTGTAAGIGPSVHPAVLCQNTFPTAGAACAGPESPTVGTGFPGTSAVCPERGCPNSCCCHLPSLPASISPIALIRVPVCPGSRRGRRVCRGVTAQVLPCRCLCPCATLLPGPGCPAGLGVGL